MYRNKWFSKFLLAIFLIWIDQIKCTSVAWHYDCPNNTRFANNSPFQTNLNTLFRSLATNATNNPSGYHRATVNNPTSEPIYGHYLCRGDQNTSSCHDCVTLATTIDLPKTYCPNRKIGIIWYDQCMVRYSNDSFFDRMDDVPSQTLYNTYSIIGNNTDYTEARDNLLIDVSSRTAEGGSFKKFATGFTNFSIITPIYGMGQCTPDLTHVDCYMCLNSTIESLTKNLGGRVLAPSCFLRYEYDAFFNLSYLPSSSQPPLLSPPSFPPSPVTMPRGKKEKKKVSLKLAAWMTVGVIVFSVTLFLLVICLRKYKSKKFDKLRNAETGIDDQDFAVESLQHDLATLVIATNDFSDENKLGEGGFGSVYKGILPDGRLIAVKRLSASSSQGIQEFRTEVLVVANLQHRNLVRLLGFCYAKQEKLLVYELVANKSLDNFLFDHENRRQLDWPRRYNIIRGIARGLLYLHHDSQLRIIHRDLKPSNVLLDEKLNPKISDFGTSRIFGVDHTQSNYTNRVVGTYGYMAPEYALQGQFSIKSDAYSFGVLVLEIISGRRNSNTFGLPGGGEDLQSHAWRHWEASTPLDFVDPIIRDSCSNNSEVMRCIHLGLLCVQESVDDRPTMANVVLTLDSHSVTLPRPQQPTFVSETRAMPTILTEVGSDHSSSKSTTLYVNDDVSITEVEPR